MHDEGVDRIDQTCKHQDNRSLPAAVKNKLEQDAQGLRNRKFRNKSPRKKDGASFKIHDASENNYEAYICETKSDLHIVISRLLSEAKSEQHAPTVQEVDKCTSKISLHANNWHSARYLKSL